MVTPQLSNTSSWMDTTIPAFPNHQIGSAERPQHAAGHLITEETCIPSAGTIDLALEFFLFSCDGLQPQSSGDDWAGHFQSMIENHNSAERPQYDYGDPLTSVGFLPISEFSTLGWACTPTASKVMPLFSPPISPLMPLT